MPLRPPLSLSLSPSLSLSCYFWPASPRSCSFTDSLGPGGLPVGRSPGETLGTPLALCMSSSVLRGREQAEQGLLPWQGPLCLGCSWSWGGSGGRAAPGHRRGKKQEVYVIWLSQGIGENVGHALPVELADSLLQGSCVQP